MLSGVVRRVSQVVALSVILGRWLQGRMEGEGGRKNGGSQCAATVGNLNSWVGPGDSCGSQASTDLGMWNQTAWGSNPSSPAF